MIISIFINIQLLTKCLRAVFTLNRDIYNSIAIVIILDLIHDNINTKISSLFKISDKSINKIQQILCSAKAKNLSKQAIDQIDNITIAF